MRPRTLAWPAVLALLLAGRPPEPARAAAPAPAPAAAMARTLFDHQSFLRGDRDGGVRFALASVRDFQGTPVADLAARLALLYEAPLFSSVNVGEAEARRVLDSESELTPETRDALRRFIARSLAAGGHREEALAMHRRRGLAMSWLTAGPFRGRRNVSFASGEIPLAGPASDLDVIGNPPDARLFGEWRKRPPWRPLHANRSFPYVRPWRSAKREGGGAMLMFTALSIDSPDNQAVFHLLCDVSWKLYIDGQLAAEMDKNAAETPREHLIAYPLAAGAHPVLLQLFPPRANLPADQVRAALRLESSSTFAWDCGAAEPEWFKPGPGRREARRLRYLDDLRAIMDESPVLTAAYGLACLEQGMRDAASWWLERAARAEPPDANFQALAGLAVSLNPLLPPGRRGDLAAAWHRTALENRPDTVPSLLFLSRAATGAGREREAFLLLEKAKGVNPDSLDVGRALGEWADRFASESAALAAWSDCARLFPGSPIIQAALAARPSEGFTDMDRRLAACRAALAAGPYDFEVSLRLADALADSGNGLEASYVLRDAAELFAGDAAALSGVAEVYARLAMHREALEALSGAVRLAPEDPALWRRLGDLRLGRGDAEAARKFWSASLAADPGQFDLADMLDALAGRPDSFPSDDGYDAIAMTAEAAGSGSLPGDVVRLLDRDELIFAADGSYRRILHEVDLARNRAGGELLARIEDQGEILAARIVSADGLTSDPEPFPGQGGLRLPVILPGSARETKFLGAFPADADATPVVPAWFFQDPAGDTPFLISEFVVRAPKDFPLVHALRNFGNQVEFHAAAEDGLEVRRWTARLRLPSREPDAVHVSERVPAVTVGVKTTWDEAAFRELRNLEWRLTPSYRMSALLTSLRQSGADGRPDPERTARAIYRHVCENIESAPSGEMAAHIQVDRLGDRRLLLLALLRLAGLDAQPAAARPNQRYLHPPIWELPDLAVFTVPLVRLTLPGGAQHWLDTRFEALPFGSVANDLSGAAAVSCLPAGPLFETLPNLPAEDSLIARELLLQLPGPADAPALVSGRILTRGVGGLRQARSLDRASRIEQRRMILSGVHPAFPDAVLARHEILRPGVDEAGSQVRFELESRHPLETRPDGTRTASLCLMPLRLVSPESRNLSRRRTACHIRDDHMSADSVTFNLPPGAGFTALPEPAHLLSRFGLYQLRVQFRGGNRLVVTRVCQVPAQRIQPWDWSDFLIFLRQMELAERQWLEYSAPGW